MEIRSEYYLVTISPKIEEHLPILNQTIRLLFQKKIIYFTPALGIEKLIRRFYFIWFMAATMLVFYRFKSMSAEEKEKANKEWHDLKNSLPSGIELLGEYDHAWGTEYNGFLLFETETSDMFLDWWAKFKDKVRWYVEQTHTIVARRR